MANKKLGQHTALALKALDKNEPFPATVFLPPALRDGPHAVYAFTSALPDIKQNIVRIQNECDPIGMMIAIAMGMPVATHYVTKDENGNVVLDTKYETLPLDNPIRERVIRSLSDKIVPRLSVHATMAKSDDKPGGAEWEATIGSAADRLDE